MSWWITKVEISKDGTRTAYHQNGGEHNVDPARVTKVWTHPDTPEERATCEACIALGRT